MPECQRRANYSGIRYPNAPWVPTGYGAQSALMLPHLKEPYDLMCSAFFGLEGAPNMWNGIPVLPGLGPDCGNAALVQHAARFFGGDPKAGLVVTLMDVWILDPDAMSNMNIASWVPVDHEPAPPGVREFFVKSGAIPIAMSRFGQEMLSDFDALYCPHAVNTEIYRPASVETRAEARDSLPKDAFLVGMVAANKGRPSRKAFSQALVAFARFAKRHEEAYLYLHTQLDPGIANGENLMALIDALGIPFDRVRRADPYRLMHYPYSDEEMADIFSGFDVLLNPSFGEGFGCTVLEANACGVPAIVTDFTAMREVCGAGWKVGYEPYWSGLGSWQAIPNIDEIEQALEDSYALSVEERTELSRQGQEHAANYDIRKVAAEHMVPALEEAQRRFDARAEEPAELELEVAA